MTGYVVYYSDRDTDRIESVPASSTSSLITGLTINITYNFSVEATSEHLSGESEVVKFNVTFTTQPTVAFTTQATVAFTTQPTEMTTTSGSVIIYTSCYKALFTVGSSSSDDTIVIIVGVLSILTLMIINPRRTCAARVTVVVLCVCVCVCVSRPLICDSRN